MHSLTYQLSRQIKCWALAAVMVLFLASLLGAGHIHASLEERDDHCTLCQHPVPLDKPPVTADNFWLPQPRAQLPAVYFDPLYITAALRSTAIRAPPITTYYPA
jgi:hypothetical protein